MDIGKPINEYVQQLQDGMSYMDDIHANISEETLKKLTSTLYIDKVVGTYGHAGRNTQAIIRVNDGEYLDNEHIIKTTKNDKTGDYNIKYEGANQQNYIPTDIKISKQEYNNFFKGSTISPDAESMLRNRFSRFSRYGYIDIAGEFLTGTREYLFFSKPDLHLMNDDGTGTMYSPLKTNPFLVEAFNHYRHSFYSLQQFTNTRIAGDDSIGSIFDINSMYIPLLSNMATSTLDLGDITANDVENNKNLYQVNTTYRESSYTSDMLYDFSIEFKDTKYLDVYMFFKIYDEYCRHKYFEEIEPAKPEYILSKIYPEAFSIWKVIVDDTDRIMYWAKAIAVTPMSVPRGSMSNFENQVKLTINFKAQFVKDMDPMNLMELNNLTLASLGHNLDKSEIALPSDGETWVGYPYVAIDNENINTSARTGDNGAKSNNKFYKLMWIK